MIINNIFIFLTDSTICVTTWKTTYAVRIQSTHSGILALLSRTAKNNAITVKK